MLIKKLRNPLKHLSFSPPLLLVYYYILGMCIIVMHGIHRPLRRAKVDQRVSSWSGGQTCYRKPLSIANEFHRGAEDRRVTESRSVLRLYWYCKDAFLEDTEILFFVSIFGFN
jgi:hypothetical protein